MKFDILTKMLYDTSDITLLKNIANDKLDKPILLDKILTILSDDGQYIVHIGKDKALSLFRLAKEYFNSCWSSYLDSSMGGVRLDRLIEYATREIYYIEAPDGIRIATTNEVNDGAEQLVRTTVTDLDEEVLQYLNLLLWTFTGHLRYYKAAGLSYTYIDGKLDETDYQLIYRAGQKLRGMIDWINISGNYERAIATLKISKRSFKYNYPTFARDEIRAEIPVKQIQYLCKLNIPGKGATETQAEVKKILFKMEKSKYKPTPYDISLMRKAYSEIQQGIVKEPDYSLNNDIEELCTKLKNGVTSNVLKPDHFAMKIVSTIEKTGRCSEKQLSILKSAEAEMDRAVICATKDKQKTETHSTTEEDSMRELFEMSEALGLGNLGG